MKTIWAGIVVFLLSVGAYAGATSYVKQLCQNDAADVACIKVQRGDSWQSLWPDPQQQGAVARLNRMNTPLEPGMIIAVPHNLSEAGTAALLPLPERIQPFGKKLIWVDLKNLAWAAYDETGQRVYWGPASGARGFCPDMDAKCTTPTGNFTIYRKEGEACVSTKFPIPDGGAPMPYCMFFEGGFAIHGSYEVPGYNASHGCVRIFPEDAQWLNQNFIDVGSTEIVIAPH